MEARSIVSRIVALVAAIGIILFLNWAFVPAITLGSSGFWWFMFFSALILCGSFAIAEFVADDDAFIVTIIAGGLAALILLVMIIGAFASGELCNSSRYRELITIDDGVFSEDIVNVDNVDNVAIVDVATANKVGDRTIASEKNATWYEVGNEYNLIVYQGKQYRLSDVSYGGLFKFNKAKVNGIPGYVLVNVYNQDADFIHLDEGINYAPSAYFSHDLARHLRNQYKSYIFGKSFFEIDEEGRPYWVTGVMTPTIGFWGGQVQKSVIVTDAVNGQSEEYSIKEIPEWIDHAFSLDYMMERVNCNYKYINGYFNFSKTGVNCTTYVYRDSSFTGYNSMVINGDVCFYTGVTPANGAESNLGFILANAKTGQIKYYSCTGAEESSAQAAAEGLVQNLGYKATFPLMLNVDGEPTYLMLLKDGAGLIQKYALCNVSNYTEVVEANTLEEAMSKYRAKSGLIVVAESTEKTGVISEITTAQIEGYTYFYFKLEGDNNIYMSSIMNGNKQVFMAVGAKVTIEYAESNETGIRMVTSIKIN